MKTRSLDRKLAKRAPESCFDSPFGIVEELLFTKGEKIATLNRWRQTILSASGTADRSALLEQIEQAKSRLGA